MISSENEYFYGQNTTCSVYYMMRKTVKETIKEGNMALPHTSDLIVGLLNDNTYIMSRVVIDEITNALGYSTSVVSLKSFSFGVHN